MIKGETLKSLHRISKVTQTLADDLLLSHVQELYNRPFASLEEIDEVRDKGISTILGPETSEETYQKTLRQVKRLFDFEAGNADIKITLGVMLGEGSQRSSFAHQTSAVIDSIVQSFRHMPADMRAAMGATLLAKLYLLRTTINSYRSEGSAANLGLFEYPWQPDDHPLKVYCDIGIQLGLARAENAPRGEQKVRIAGKAALQLANQPGQKGFDKYWYQLFERKPEEALDRATKQRVMHSSFAVLIILVLKQAVYHTIRARLVERQEGRITVALLIPCRGAVIKCRIENPEVKKNDRETRARDVDELATLAVQLSKIPGDPSRYSVEGPRFDQESGRWATTIRVFEKTNLEGASQ